jgi:hypothetical protein
MHLNLPPVGIVLLCRGCTGGMVGAALFIAISNGNVEAVLVLVVAVVVCHTSFTVTY